MFRAVIYLLILLMGLTLAAFGAYVILFMAFRMAQFLHDAIFAHRWLG